MMVSRRIVTGGTLLLIAAAMPTASGHAQGSGYCFGDPGSGIPCPCNNDNDGSVPGSGCDNGVFASGAQLTGSGVADINADSLVLATTNLEPGNAGLYFQADNPLSPAIPWGDGLRCAGGNLRRLGVRVSDANGYSDTSGFPYTISERAGNIAVGDTKYYQCWYRTTSNPPCGTGVNDFNASNGYAITWASGGGVHDGMAPVPAGTFAMGDHAGIGGWDEKPVHTVNLGAFYMDVCEVTNAEFAAYLNGSYAQGRITVIGGKVYQLGGGGKVICDTTWSSNKTRITWDLSTFGVIAGKEDHPMVMVSWYGACLYANERSRQKGLTPCYDESVTNDFWICDFNADGFRLPTEAEWEYAARGDEHNPYYMYPWGNDLDGSKTNFWQSGDPYETGSYPETTPVGYYDGNQVPPGVDMANGYGLYDMSGNVSEWCWDWYDPDYYISSPNSNPTGPSTPTHSTRVLRGGNWNVDHPSGLRTPSRYDSYQDSGLWYLGFRLVAVHR